MTINESIPSPSTPLHIGAAWHPELWPEDQWPLDVARMKEVGINRVRLFEFAWHRFEPREWESYRGRGLPGRVIAADSYTIAVSRL